MALIYKIGFNVLLIIYCSICVISDESINPCLATHHKTFFNGNFGSRNAHCKTDDVDTRLCDYFLRDSWYVVEDGALTNSCPAEDCGVSYPIWMNGSFPGEKDGVVNRTACIKKGRKCCGGTISIQIKNCTQFLVYYLRHAEECSSVYCFDSGLPCEEVTDVTTESDINEEQPDNLPEHQTVNTRNIVAVVSVVSLLVGCGISLAVVLIVQKFSRRENSTVSKITLKQIETVDFNTPPPYEDIYPAPEECKKNIFI